MSVMLLSVKGDVTAHVAVSVFYKDLYRKKKIGFTAQSPVTEKRRGNTRSLIYPQYPDNGSSSMPHHER